MTDIAESVDAGTAAFNALNRQAQTAGASIAAALAAGQIEGRKLEDVLKAVGARLGEVALRTAGASLSGALTTTLSNSLISTIASGGVATPSLAAPASLATLGSLSASGRAAFSPSHSSAQGARPIVISMNISSPDANSFRHSESQVSASLLRAVQRGQRNL